jgi:hypothetical protein
MISNKLSSKKAILGVVALIIVLIGAALYFSSSKKSPETIPHTKTEQSATSNTSESDQPATTDTSTPAQQEPEKLTPAKNVPSTPEPSQAELDKIDTSNWKTYTSNDYGFEIKYPSDWSVITRKDSGVAFLAPETPKFNPDELGWGNVSIGMQKSGPSDAPDQYFSKTPIILDKGSGNLYTGVNCGQDPQYPNISCNIADLTKDSREIVINYFDELEKKDSTKYIGVYYKMINTFKFIK